MVFGWIAKKVIGGLFGGPALEMASTVVNGWMDRKKVKAETKTKIELARQEVLTKQATADIDWDMTMAKASKDSWKDEYWTVIVSIPLIGGFVPSWAPYILDGFAVLAQMPVYYQGFVGVAFAAAFGRNEAINIAKRWSGAQAVGSKLKKGS